MPMDDADRRAAPSASKPVEVSPEDKERQIIWDVLRSITATWRLPVLIALLVGVFLSAAIVFIRSASVSTTTYLSRMSFVFPGAENGVYPSGMSFSINEVIEPSILEMVYDQLKLDTYGIDRGDFFVSFSIRPYAPTQSEVSDRFRLQLADRRLTFSERERVEAQFKAQLDKESRAFAELAFTISGRFGIPDELGRTIVNTVPLVWSQTMITKRGALRLPGFSAKDTGINPELTNELPLPTAIVVLMEANYRLSDRIEQLRRIPGLQVVRDGVTNRSFQDLERDSRDLWLLKIGPLRHSLVVFDFRAADQERTRLLIDRRVRDLEIVESDYVKNVEVGNQALTQYVEATVGLAGRMGPERRGGGGEPGSVIGVPTIPQLSESFIDRIIEISGRGRGDDQKFIVGITDRQLRLNERLVAIRSELEQWRELSRSIFGNQGGREPLTDQRRGELEGTLKAAVNELNRDWATLTRLEGEFSANRASHTGRLYTAYVSRDGTQRANPLRDIRNYIIVLAATMMALIGVWYRRGIMYWQTVRRQRLS